MNKLLGYLAVIGVGIFIYSKYCDARKIQQQDNPVKVKRTKN